MRQVRLRGRFGRGLSARGALEVSHVATEVDVCVVVRVLVAVVIFALEAGAKLPGTVRL